MLNAEELSAAAEMLSPGYERKIDLQLKMIRDQLEATSSVLSKLESGEISLKWSIDLTKRAMANVALNKFGIYLNATLPNFVDSLSEAISLIDEKLDAVQQEIRSRVEAKWKNVREASDENAHPNVNLVNMHPGPSLKDLSSEYRKLDRQKVSFVSRRDELQQEVDAIVQLILNLQERIWGISDIEFYVEEQNSVVAGPSVSRFGSASV